MIYTPSEIKSRAMTFTREHLDWADEKSQAQSFWRDFLGIWGVPVNKVAVFEERVKTHKQTTGFIDLFWPGLLLVEHKSRGKDLDEAYKQALDYIPGLKDSEVPRYVVVSDFARFRIHCLGDKTMNEFNLEDLHKNTHLFNFIMGYEKRIYRDQDPVNIVAAELMGKLHDGMKAAGFDGHPLEVFLVRSMFMMFADDTGIFPKDHMTFYLEAKTKEDGSDFGPQLAYLFQILNTPPEKRPVSLDGDLALFPYVNGQLFEEPLIFPSFDRPLRDIFMKCCYFNWALVSPAIFGSLFQSVMDAKARRNLGAHYTSEKNILKTIHGLFLDELHEQFEKVKTQERGLRALLERIRNIRFLDPACGCGNFLILAYRELRQLEIEIHTELRKITKSTDQTLDIGFERGITVDHVYGIEIEEFPAQIARVALWIMDHLMNVEMARILGGYQPSVPLRTSPHIVQGNALRLDWKEIVKPEELTFILGNPPFVGKHLMSKEQSKDMSFVFSGKLETYGILDFVSGWYAKAAELFERNGRIKCAFVSTNSITQGEQPGSLWPYLFSLGIKIHFAHRTFKWTNEAKGNAGVFCVIIGFGKGNIENKMLFDYHDLNGEPLGRTVRNISPYLVAQSDIVVQSRRSPICSVPEMQKGSQPTDDGNLLLSNEERELYLASEPNGISKIFPLVSAREFLHNEKRWCFWLVNLSPKELGSLPSLKVRLERVKKFRLESKKEATRKWAEFPSLFTENRQPFERYILIPRHSSENRIYVPFGYFNSDYIVADSCISIPGASPYHFGIIQSLIHMAWMRQVCGRLKSDYRYSNSLVYNNFPWPESPTDTQKQKVEECAQAVLDARTQFPDSSLADLYDPLTMPPVLVKAHQALDKAVDACYRKEAFKSELDRVEYLFELYEKYTRGLLAGSEKKKRK